jgi:hypothetical protein
MADTLNTKTKKQAQKTEGSNPATPSKWHLTSHLVSTSGQFQINAPCQRCQERFLSDAVKLDSLSPEQLDDLPHSQLEHWERFIQEQFRQCKACSKWVCRDSCWEPIRMKCEGCANPNVHYHQADSSSDSDTQESVYSSILGGICQHCNMILPAQGKDCPECGKS